MDYTTNGKENAFLLCTTEKERAVLEVSKDFILPDCYADIKKLLMYDVSLIPDGGYTQAGKAKYAGTVECRVLFLTDEGNVRCATFKTDYEGSSAYEMSVKDAENLLDECAFFSQSVDSCSVRASNPRKITLKVNIKPGTKIWNRCTYSVELPPEFDDADRANLEYMEKDISAADAVSYSSGILEAGDDIVIPRNQPAAESILYTDVKLCDLKPTVMNGSVSVSGDVNVTVIYTYDNDGKEDTAFITHSFPINESIETPMLDENCKAAVKGYVNTVSSAAAEDADGANRVIELDITYTVNAYGMCKSVISAAFDVYSDRYDIESVDCTYNYPTEPERIDIKTSVSAQCEALQGRAAVFTFANAKIDGFCKGEDGTAVCGKVTFTYLSKDEDGRLSQDICESEFSANAPDHYTDYVGSAYTCKVKTEISDGKVNMSSGVNLNMLAWKNEKTQVICKVNNAGEAQNERRSTFTVYYPEENDTLWNIAKKYRVSKNMIMSANSLASEDIKGIKAILIPGRSRAVFSEII